MTRFAPSTRNAVLSIGPVCKTEQPYHTQKDMPSMCSREPWLEIQKHDSHPFPDISTREV